MISARPGRDSVVQQCQFIGQHFNRQLVPGQQGFVRIDRRGFGQLAQHTAQPGVGFQAIGLGRFPPLSQ